MRKLKLLVLTVAAFLTACGSSDNSLNGTVLGPGGLLLVNIGTLTLLTSSPQIPSDGGSDATITALVRDANNNVMEGVPVLFTANSGSLVVTQPALSDQAGQLTATLSTAGDTSNRTITVTAIADTTQATVTVDVVGTTLALNGPTSLPLGDTGNFNVVLTDAGGNGIGGTPVTITSSNANTISTTPVTTDAAGQASFTLTANNGGVDSVNAQGAGLVAISAVTVSPDSFSFTAPAPDTEIDLNTNQTVTVNWQTSGAAVVGQPVNFTITRGTVSASTVNTDAAGNATINVMATNAGPAVIIATNGAGTSTQLVVEFVATVPDTLELQANPFTIAPQEQSAITAVVRDPAGNLVKNQVVGFTATDVTGGQLSVPQATTDSQGRAQTFYTASTTTSASDGVVVTATVQGFPLVTDTVNLTVAARELFLSIGTGNEVFEPNSSQYFIEYAVQVTDAEGNGVEDVTVQVNILSQRYWDGIRTFPLGGTCWVTNQAPAAGCPDEDVNRNGIIDGGEDLNTSGDIEAGNIATVVAQGIGGGTFQSDQNGFGIVEVWYPQEYAYWLEVTLEATTSVQGTEFAESATFLPPGTTTDFCTEDNAPPGIVSPFGTDGMCATPPPPLGP